MKTKPANCLHVQCICYKYLQHQDTFAEYSLDNKPINRGTDRADMQAGTGEVNMHQGSMDLMAPNIAEGIMHSTGVMGME